MRLAAVRQFLAHLYGGDELDYHDPELEQAAAGRPEAYKAARQAAIAAVPPSDAVGKRLAAVEELTAQSQLVYGRTYLKQIEYGLSDPLTELPLSNLPEDMQAHYRAALQSAAAGGAGNTEGDSGTDSSEDDSSEDDSCNDSGNDENDENVENRY
jgi:hypothetical protein